MRLPADYPELAGILLDNKADLISDARRGDPVAFRRLIEKHGPRVYSIAYQITGNSADAQDIAQEIFIKLHGALHKFSPDYRFTTWLYRMAVNTSIDYQRKQARRKDFPLEEIESMSVVEDRRDNPEALHERKELKGIISRLTGLLTEKQRKVFILRDIQSFSTPEIARILNCSQITVRVHLASARTRIKTALKQYYPEFDTCNPLPKGGYK